MARLDLAVIGNSVIAALIDRCGRYVWCCFPRLDGDPVFCSLLDEDGTHGFMDAEVQDCVSTIQQYRGNTAILETTLVDGAGGSIRIVDFIPRYKQFERVFRPTMIVRRIEPQEKICRIRLRVRPKFRYGAVSPSRVVGSNHVRFVADPDALRVTTDAPVPYLVKERWFELTAPVTLVLGADAALEETLTAISQNDLIRTEDYWTEWSRYLSIPFEWQAAVIRAAITLKLCAFEETGAIVSALTTSVPEAPGTARNWDYRYCWLRDANFVVHALNRLGATRTMEDFIGYISNVAALTPNADLRPVYGIVPGNPLPERIITSLPGFGDEGPVRVGNAAEDQIQNDSYGSVVLAAAQTFFDMRVRRFRDMHLFAALERLGVRAAELAFEPDAGLWEFRSRLRVHTHSSAMCWAACDRLAKLARVLGLAERASHWHGIAEEIRNTILSRAWCEARGCFVESFDSNQVDASLLLLPEIGFVAYSDPRFVGTLRAIEADLVRDGHVMRYAAPDDFGLPKTSFGICTFWYIDALAAVGRRDEARAIFERMLGLRNHVGLLSEDVDPVSGELWGNFPQTYTLVGLIISAMRLSKSWEEAFWRGS